MKGSDEDLGDFVEEQTIQWVGEGEAELGWGEWMVTMTPVMFCRWERIPMLHLV